MKKLYVDQILQNRDNVPGAGMYEHKGQFDKKAGQGSYTFRKKLLEEERRL